MILGPMPRARLIAALAFASFVSIARTADAAGPSSTGDGVFTEAQAKAGETAYQSHCAGCHGLDLKKTDAEAPDLTGGPYRFGWNGKSIGERFQKTKTTMPKAAPASLPDQTYLDIIAYILSFNGSPAGATALGSDMAGLDGITIEIAQPAGGGRRR